MAVIMALPSINRALAIRSDLAGSAKKRHWRERNLESTATIRDYL